MTIYFTGKGDKGHSLVGSKRVAKNSLILRVLGELDELNSLIGLSKNYLPKKYFVLLTEIQNDIFIIQANVAWFIYSKFKAPKLKKERIEFLEKEIIVIENKINRQQSFVIYGSSQSSAWFDYLRAKVRSIEREIVSFNQKHKLQSEILSYLNRLSSYFYVLARKECYNKRITEIEPWY